jgi:hypothetical protein
MDDPFSDDRIQFYLRNRDDIRTWAAIETEVMAATRELLASAEPTLDERLLAIDPQAVVGRLDGGSWERIIVRHATWPRSVGLALEWHRSVDPLGASPPKIGVFFWADPPTLVPVREAFRLSVAGAGLQQFGYKVPLESVWPVGVRVVGPPDWWTDPTRWLDGVMERLIAAWPIVAPRLDEILAAG